MKRKIAISMGQTFLDKRNETRDFIDVRLIDFIFRSFNCEVVLINNFVTKNIFGQKRKLFSLLKNNKIKGIILSGGEDFGKNYLRDQTEINLIKFAITKRIPLAGICRGMQVINFFFKGKLKKITKHVAVKNKIYSIKKKDIRKVKCFHNNGIKKLGLNLVETYRSDDGEIEAFIHNKNRIMGIMWHPERNRIFNINDINLFKKFFN